MRRVEQDSSPRSSTKSLQDGEAFLFTAVAVASASHDWRAAACRWESTSKPPPTNQQCKIQRTRRRRRNWPKLNRSCASQGRIALSQRQLNVRGGEGGGTVNDEKRKNYSQTKKCDGKRRGTTASSPPTWDGHEKIWLSCRSSGSRTDLLEGCTIAAPLPRRLPWWWVCTSARKTRRIHSLPYGFHVPDSFLNAQWAIWGISTQLWSEFKATGRNHGRRKGGARPPLEFEIDIFLFNF